jgi:PAS domain S-box-containing protein
MSSRSFTFSLGRYSHGALKIAGGYLLVGAIWILFSDKLAEKIASNQSVLTTISIYKGWGFIIVTALMLYWLIQRQTAALSRSEERLITLTNALPALISYVDKDRRYRFSNQAYEEWFGHNAEGKEMAEVIGTDAYQKLSPYIDAVLEGETLTYETELRLKGAGTRFVSATYVPDQEPDGEVRGFYALVQDITERRQAEEERRQWADAFEHCAHGIAIDDPATNRIVVCNSAFALLHKSRVEDIVGTAILSLYAPSDHSHLRYNVTRADQIGHAQFEASMIRRDESIFPVQMDLVSVRGDYGDLLYRVATVQDISERKKAEKEIAYQANILEHVNDAVITSDENLVITSWNSAAELMYGWKAGEVIGRKGEDVLCTEFFNKTRAEAIQGLRESGEFSAEVTQMRKDGTRFHVDARTVAVRAENGNVTGFVGVNRDITGRKLAEAAALENEIRYRSVLDAMMEGCQIIDFDWRYVYVNNVVAEQGQRKPEELLHHTMMEIYPGIEHTEFFAVLKQCMEERIARRMENQFVFPSGSVGWFELSIQPAREGIFILSTDITERKQVKEALQRAHDELELKVQERTASLSQTNALLQALMDYMPDHIYFKDTQGRFIRNSKSQAEMLGVSNPEEVIGKTDFDFFPHAAKAYAEEQEVIRSGQPLVDFEEQVIWPDKRETWVSTTKVPLRNSEGQTIGIFGISRDITERKKAEQSIRQLNMDLTKKAAQLHTANKELEAFSYSISHDLRAPLRAINGFTRILIEDYSSALDEEGRRVCKVITTETRRMGNLIDDLLAFSRLSRKEIQTAKIDMKALAYSVFGELTTEEQRTHIDFKIGRLPHTKGDPALIHQVWMNIISNAIKFSSKKEPAVIEVGTKRSENETIYCVRDNGAGFDIQYVDKLFNVFQRLHSEDEFEGTGVGLAIVQRIIQRHGGRVWAEGEVDKGATFYFALPRERDNHE